MSRVDGFVSAPIIPVGATIKRAYWAIPGLADIGPEFETKDLVLEEAINAKRAAVAKHEAHYLSLPGTIFVPLPETIWVVFRWDLAYEGGGGLDTEVLRCEYSTIAEADEALAMYRRAYAGATR